MATRRGYRNPGALTRLLGDGATVKVTAATGRVVVSTRKGRFSDHQVSERRLVRFIRDLEYQPHRMDRHMVARWLFWASTGSSAQYGAAKRRYEIELERSELGGIESKRRNPIVKFKARGKRVRFYAKPKRRGKKSRGRKTARKLSIDWGCGYWC